MRVATGSSELKKRVLTALAGASVVLAIIIYAGWPGISLLTLIISLAMSYEYASIVYALPDARIKRWALVGATFAISLLTLSFPRSEYEILVGFFILFFALFLLTARWHQARVEEFQAHLRELMFTVFGLLYLAFIPGYLRDIHASINGAHWTLLFLFLNWAGDIGAYFIGKRFGRHKLYPLISPKKTREGAAGGIVCGLAVALLYRCFYFDGYAWPAFVIIPVVVGAVAQVGDLCESFLKRSFDRKDSGSLLPGHGGFLDRFDGVVFSLPVMYACVRIFG